jgi:hypothetical protein
MYDHLFMIILATGEIRREPPPLGLWGLPPDVLLDLSTWLGYEHLAFYPGEVAYPPLQRYQSYGAETWVLDSDRKVVKIEREVIDWTPAEILEWKRTTTRHITHLALRKRFTYAERLEFEMAALDNPAGTQAERQAAAGVRVLEKDMAAARHADLNLPELQDGLRTLEAIGVLTVGRADQIIWGDIEDYEVA